MKRRNRRWLSLGAAFLLVAAAAPFFGLLGTVTGMIRSFGDIAEAELATGGEIATNVSYSLKTTYIGLAVSGIAATIGLILTTVGLIGYFGDKADVPLQLPEDQPPPAGE